MPLDLEYMSLNSTELVAICRRAGYLHAHRGIKREDLIRILEEEVSMDSYEPDPVDEYREAMLHMQERWPIVKRQLPCAQEFYACWHCPAGRVIYCITENCDEGLLEAHGLPVPERGKKGNKHGRKGEP